MWRKNTVEKIRRLFLCIGIALTIFFTSGSVLAGQTVALPITINYSLLRKLVVDQAFYQQNESITLLDEQQGCSSLILSAPRIEEQDGTIRFEMQVAARGGTAIGGKCFSPIEWQGFLTLYQVPSFSPEDWTLSFSTVDSELTDQSRNPAQMTDLLWNLIKPHIWSYIGSIEINLMPPVEDLKTFILPLFPPSKQQQTSEMLASMRPGNITVADEALRLRILADVREVYSPDAVDERQHLDEEELKETIALWERWDGLLVYMVTRLAKEELDEAEKRILTNALLDTRYRFVNELADRSLSYDIVRQQFVHVWQQLEPLFRKHILLDDSETNTLGYLAFIASADALLVFDRLGPTFGVEISTNGLLRLAKMLRANPALLQYRSGVNPELQKLFEIQQEEVDEPDNNGDSSSFLFRGLRRILTVSTAHASSTLPTFKEILQWKVPKTDIDDYLKRVEKVLRTSSNTMVTKGKVEHTLADLYEDLILAMAWQESCFRQFVVDGKQLTYLLSYNNTSVGLMQVNERIWRGLYRRDRLRWDINYNATAGSEIAALYLNKYALRGNRQQNNLDAPTLARVVYAMYNGGPSQYAKFLKRKKTDTFYSSDELFWEKFNWVQAGKIDKVSICLVGK